MKIRFIAHKEDDNHCLQACLMMAADAVGCSLNWKEVDSLTSYDPNLYTWSSAVIANFSKIIPNTKLISGMDYKAFSEQGEDFLRKLCNPEWFALQQSNASPNFEKEQLATKKAVEMELIEKSNASPNFEKLLEDNFLIVLVDAGRLSGENYSSAHFVFLYNSDSVNFEIHNPGLPGRKKWKVNKNLFNEAFCGDVIVVPRTSIK